MPNDQLDDAAVQALSALTAIPTETCTQLPPRRIPLGDGQECLVQWQPDSIPGKWQLNLTKRSESPVDETAAGQSFQATIDMTNKQVTVDRTGDDATFFVWVEKNLVEIAADTRNRQELERPSLMARAQVSSQSMTIKDFIPHIVILIALAAFAYMFAIVHIKI